MRRIAWRAWLAWGVGSVVAAGGCYEGGGQASGMGDDDGAEDGADGAMDDGDPPPRTGDEDTACDGDVGSAPLRRLNRAQYDHTIRDLLGQDLALSQSFFADEKVAAFDSNATAPVTDLGVEQYMNAAEVAAATAVADLSALLPCDPEVDGQSECAAAFIAQFAPRVYRRPLTEEQLADANALYADARAEGTFDEAIRVTVQGLLQSPYFLYHLESVPTDEDGALQVLSGYEVASRLSYFFWESMPDEALFTAAAADALSTEAEIEAQARRMLADARASDTIRHFHTQWLGLEGLAFTGKDADLFPSFTPALADAMRLELERFAEYVILEDDARFETLMTSPKASLDAELAAVYGVDAPEGLDWVDLPADQRAGLLTRAAVMATHSHENQTSPVLRGAMVRTNILCQTPPPPPDTVDDTPPGLDPSLPTKERFAEHRDNPSCAGCHDLMDPLGYGLEHYDAIGAYRTMDGVNPVDATGEIAGTLDGPVDYDGPIEFSALLAAGEQARQCVSKQWFRYALGRFDAVADQCTIDKIYARFTASDFDIRELMVAIAVSDAMRNFKAATIDAD